MMKSPFCQILIAIFLLTPLALAAQQTGLFYSHENPQVDFAASEIIANHINIGPTCFQGLFETAIPATLKPNLDRIFQRARILDEKTVDFASFKICGQ